MSVRSEVIRIFNELIGQAKKISDLPAAGSIAGADLVEVSQGGVSKKATITQVATGGAAVWGGIGGTLSDQTDLNTALTARVLKAGDTMSGNLAMGSNKVTGLAAATANGEAVRYEQIVGTQDLFISAAAMWPRTTGGCSDLAKEEMATSLANVQYLEFPNSGQTFAQFQIVPPRKWNNGTVTACVHWKPSASGSGDLRMGIQLASYRNDDALTGAFGTEVAVTDTFLATADFHTTADSAAITASGTVQDGNLLMCQINRDAAHGSDTLDVAARIIGITFRFVTDAAIDA